MEEPGQLQSMVSQRAGHDEVTNTFTVYKCLSSQYRIGVIFRICSHKLGYRHQPIKADVGHGPGQNPVW